MEDSERKFLIDDFKTFNPPQNYKGGCIKTRLQGYCYRIRPDGKLGSVTLNCEHWDICKGEKSNFSVE
jgi:hypothetical protein